LRFGFTLKLLLFKVLTKFPCYFFTPKYYFYRDLIKCETLVKNGLTRKDLRDFAEGKPVNNEFRNLIRQYYELADGYRLKTYDVIREINPLLEPAYRLSLEIIFNLYLMVFERIDLQNGEFTSLELNPAPAEIRDRVYDTIMKFEFEPACL